MTTSDLKPCPCGKADVAVYPQPQSFTLYAVQCVCGFTGPFYSTKALAIAAWNRRTSDDKTSPAEGVMVPRVATRAMQVAGGNILKPHLDEPLVNLRVAESAYRAMLAAAPKPQGEKP